MRLSACGSSVTCGSVNVPDIGDGESKNEGPDHTEDELEIAIDDVFCSYIGEHDTSALDELECEIDILCLLYAHAWIHVEASEGCVTHDLHELNQLDTIG